MASSEEEWEVDGGAFVGDGATPADHDSQQVASADAQVNGNSDAERSDAERAVSAEKSPVRRRGGKGNNSRKRARRVVQSHNDDDDDFESQPTITKWFRQVPGPLHDVMKKQHFDLQQSLDDDGILASGRSSGHIVHISTVFDSGAWVAMCDFLGIATTPGELYGGIKMSSLKHTIAHIHEFDQSMSPQIPRLLVLIKTMKYVDEEIVAVFHDPTGELEGYFHRDIVEQVGPALVIGTAVLLRQVAVFTPSGSAVGGACKRYLNITPRNVEAVFPAAIIAVTLETMVLAFNEAQREIIRADEAAEEEARDDASLAQPWPRVLAPADVRTTTNELSFISQRQVVQRHQPVRPDPSDMSADAGDGATTGKRKKKKEKEAPTGLGRWQWHQLAQKKPAPTNDEGDDTPTKPRRPAASGRFTELLSQHIQARRTAAANVRERPADQSTLTETTPSILQNSVAATQGATAKSVRFTTIQETTIDDEDDDDDW